MKFSPLNMILKPGLFAVVALAAALSVGAAETARTFATPEAAVKALETAVHSDDMTSMHTLFGPDLEDVVNADRVQATNEFRAFVAAFNETNSLTPGPGDSRILIVGPDAYPFPIPLVHTNGAWHFDTAAGKDEILSRRIGRNELDTLKTVRAYVSAQREYASQDRNGDEVLQYAQRFISTPGTKDGLYWPLDLDGEVSPLGPAVAAAHAEGYGGHVNKDGYSSEPFHGYYYKILSRQAKSAPGGKYDYIINGRMIAGFALVAWPAEYGETGIMTFIVNQQGKVYQKDLGPKTAKKAADMKEYDPDSSWTLSRD